MGVLVKPLITEKLATENESSKFGFVVEKKANKVEIKREVEKLYGVKVLSVNTLIAPSKPKTRHSKSKVVSGRTSPYKKAIVTLAEGDYIDFYSGI